MLFNIPSELQGLRDQSETENEISADDYTNDIMSQILAAYDGDVTGSVQAAAEEMETNKSSAESATAKLALAILFLYKLIE